MPKIKFGNKENDSVFLELKHDTITVSKRVTAEVVYGGVLRWTDWAQSTDLEVETYKVERLAISRVAGQILKSPCLSSDVANNIATSLICSDLYNSFK